METMLYRTVSLLCVCVTVFGHQVKLATYRTALLMSGFIYSDHILENSNVSNVIFCALLCSGNSQCVSMSYNVDRGYCQIYGIVHCNSMQGILSNGTNYYIVYFEDSQPRSIYLKCKNTKQSSTDYGGFSSFATDGIWISNYGIRPCTHTKLENRPWWHVNLENNYIIHKIKIMNRFTGGFRLSRLIISVGEDLQSMTPCGYHANSVQPAQNVTIACDPPTKGKLVRILLDKSEYLTLCEVGVYGQIVPD